AGEPATGLDAARPKRILSASCGIEPGRGGRYKPLLDEAIRLAAAKPEACIILQRPQAEAPLVAGRDHDWKSVRDNAFVWAKAVHEVIPVAATDPLYILYTSGTTAIPKALVPHNPRP